MHIQNEVKKRIECWNPFFRAKCQRAEAQWRYYAYGSGHHPSQTLLRIPLEGKTNKNAKREKKLWVLFYSEQHFIPKRAAKSSLPATAVKFNMLLHWVLALRSRHRAIRLRYSSWNGRGVQWRRETAAEATTKAKGNEPTNKSKRKHIDEWQQARCNPCHSWSHCFMYASGPTTSTVIIDCFSITRAFDTSEGIRTGIQGPRELIATWTLPPDKPTTTIFSNERKNMLFVTIQHPVSPPPSPISLTGWRNRGNTDLN